MSSLRVLHVSHTTEGGLRTSTYHAGMQAERGWTVAIACSTDRGLDTWAGRIGAEHIPWEAKREPGAATAGEIRRLAAIVRRFDPEVVHLHSSKAGLAGRLVVRGRRPTIFQPHAWSFHAVDGAVERAALSWERWAARWAHAIVCVSHDERDRGRRAGIRARYRVVPSAIDVRSLPLATDEDRRRARSRLGLPEGPLVVCVGRLTRQKAQDVLLDAWPAVLAAVPGATVALVGDGPEEQALRRRGLDGVLFTGWRDDVSDWLAAADVVAIPSRWEGLPLVVLEAMALGRSVVSSAADGMAESLGADAGEIVPLEDPPTLAAALAERLRDPARTRAEGRAGRVRVEREFDLPQAGEAMMEVYRHVLGGSGGQRVPPVEAQPTAAE